MARLDLNDSRHVRLLVELGEEGMASGVAEDFDIDIFIEETDTIQSGDDPKIVR